MTDNPELQIKLHELEQELEDGEITAKGYQKRRTLILSQYLSPVQAEQVQRGLRVHNADDTAHPSNDGSPNNSLATEPQRSSSGANRAPRSLTPNRADFRYGISSDRPTSAADRSHIYGSSGRPTAQSHHGQPQERILGVRNPNEGGPFGQDQRYSSQLDMSGGYNTSFDNSSEPTMMSSNYAFNPATEAGYNDQTAGGYDSPVEGTTRHSTMLDQAYFTDFAGQQQGDQKDSYGGGPHRYSHGDAFSPTAAVAPPMLQSGDMPPPATVNHQLPLEPRDVPFAVYDPHNSNIPMSKFDNIATVLRHRARTNPKSPAYWVLDQKGKEISSITWDKFASRAEKVAQVVRDKSNLYRGDRVALIYRDTEVIDFAVALMGCFIAGVVAVPVNKQPGEDQRLDYHRLNLVLTTTQAHLALTTDANLKEFQRDITQNKLSWPRGVEWWKTNEFGSFHPKKKDEVPPLVVPDLAYIEFSKAPTGDLRGVVMSHRTIMHQMACLSSIIATVPTGDQDTFNSGLRDKQGRLMTGAAGAGEILLSYLDPRQGIGMILGVLLTVYGGHTTVWMENRAVESPGLYANIITKYKATLMAADYPGLKRAAYNYQSDPMTTRNFKKNFEPNFASVKLCLIDTLTVDCEFHEILADRWLRPMRNPRAREIVAPMLCLPEHGGMVISVRDWLGGEERMGCSLKLDDSSADGDVEVKKEEKPALAQNGGYNSLIGGGTSQPADKKDRTELSEVLLDKESLKTNEVQVIAIGDEARKRAGTDLDTVRVGAFGFPIPDATLAVVDPETSLLCTPNVIGEIWVDSPSLSGGFWALPKHTESIFHARPYKFSEGNPNPMAVEPEFLRTGLLGCVIEGKVFVLGLYEDRLRQKVEWVEHGMEVAEYRYFFVQHLIISIMKNVPKIYDASAFDVFVNDEHLPIILLESGAASTAPTTNGGPPRQLDTALLDSLSERCMEVLYQEHHVRVYCVMITAPGALPRTVKNGRREIGNMLCRKEFDLGTLPCVHVKFGVERAVLNLPVGVDPVGGIWSQVSTAARQDILVMQEKQYSGVDYREVVIDDRTSTPLNNFSSIVDLLQWRVARQAEELSYCTVDGRGREGKGVTWKKFDIKVASVAILLQNKAKIRPGDHVILMYTHSEEFVYAVHACFCLGAVAIPMAPLDQNRLNEDAPAYLHLVADFRVKAVLVNADVDHLLKQKLVSQHIKQSAQVLKISLPPLFNTAKPSRQASGCRELGLTMKPGWVQAGFPVLIWTYWTPDQRRIAVQLGHDTIMGMCKVQKETCQMTSSRPVLGCVRSTSGLGFIHSCLMGVFVGAPTYLVSPVDFASNPQSLFLTLSRYKIKDTYATSQMLDHAMNVMPGKGFTLHELKNMMISTEGRPRVDVFQKVRLHFAGAGLDRTAINTIYSHVLNPMIASRSYMCIEPIELWLDTRALRRGLIYPVDPDADPTALLVQDSGMVPVSTQIAIVNPETCLLCHVGEYGEIWVQSEACVRSFYGSKDQFDAERFNGRTVNGDPHVTYVRTGDLGFLHNVTRPIGPNGSQVEMQVLFVLGGIGETFEVNGLSHFPVDIEYSVEKCHRNIVPAGCAVFQAGGLVVVLVEVIRKAYLASVVPVIVNAILNEHQVVVDIIAFVSKGDFPRSRLGEKQRGKILASWVTRKMRTIAQFSIRDPEGADSQITEVPEDQIRSGSSMRQGGTMMTGSTLPDPNPTSEVSMSPLGTEQQYGSMQPDLAEMAGTGEYANSIQQSPPLVPGKIPLDERTPANTHNGRFQAQHPGRHLSMPNTNDEYFDPAADPDPTPHAEMPAFDYDTAPPPPPKFASKPKLLLPELEGEGGLGLDVKRWEGGGEAYGYGWQEVEREGGLRVANFSEEDREGWSGSATTQCAAAAPHSPLIALIHRSHLLLRSSATGKIVRSIQLDSQSSPACRRLRWFRRSDHDDLLVQSRDWQSGTSRLLVADDETIHLYDALDPHWHATINGASSNTGKIAGVEFGYTADEVVVFSDFGVKATIWSLLTSRGVEIRDPKLLSRGFCFRPRTGHLAMLTRESTKDIVMVLTPRTRELEHSFVLATVDAQGLKWSPDGRWLVTWEAASAGYNVLIYTSDGHLFRAYRGGQDIDCSGLGVKTAIWEPSERYLVIACYNHQISLLSTATFNPVAVFQHHTIIRSNVAAIWQEQISPLHGRSYVLSPQSACPSGPAPPVKEHAHPTSISHLTANEEGTLLASCSELIPTTVWIWSLDTLTPVAALIHHSPVKTLQWDPQDSCCLLIHCAIEEPVVHFWNSTWDVPRVLCIPLSKPGLKAEASWLHSSTPETPAVMLATTHNFAIRNLQDNDGDAATNEQLRLSFVGLGPEDMFDEGNSMDLSPIKLSYGQHEGQMGMGGTDFDDDVDDTFDYRRHLAVPSRMSDTF